MDKTYTHEQLSEMLNLYGECREIANEVESHRDKSGMYWKALRVMDKFPKLHELVPEQIHHELKISQMESKITKELKGKLIVG